ncbi:MAG: hypothetical protein KDB68_17920 [Planctomycetes bacterium]|nr:hypothetical protein [Planctomycetota bacterium]MCB0329166.1 hypothetical protein [Bdellovibrionales bacterium]
MRSLVGMLQGVFFILRSFLRLQLPSQVLLCALFLGVSHFALAQDGSVVEGGSVLTSSSDSDSSSQAVYLPEPFATYLSANGSQVQVVPELPKDFRFDERPEQDGALGIGASEVSAWQFEKYWSLLGVYGVNFQLSTWNIGGDRSEYQGEFIRVYPTVLESFDKNQVFRERVTLFQGVRAEGLQWLTIRPLGSSVDGIWTFSPTLKHVRRINPENREDRLLSTAVSLDDLGFISRKTDGLRVVEAEEAEYLIPFVLDKNVVGAVSEDGCVKFSPTPLRSAAPLLFGQTAGNRERIVRWMMNERFVPRKVMVTVLESENPYRELSHEILIVDKSLQIPLYRMSYDVLGRLRFASYQVLGMGVVPEGSSLSVRKVPAVAYSLLYDLEEDRLSTIATQEQRWCPLSQSYFDSFQPGRLGPESSEDTDSAAGEGPSIVKAHKSP